MTPELPELARAFLRQHSGADWRAHVESWADSRELSASTRRELRVEVLRLRCFGAAERGTARAARRRSA